MCAYTRYAYACPESAYACMKHAHAYTPKNLVPKIANKTTNLTTYHASNTKKNKKPKLAIKISRQ